MQLFGTKPVKGEKYESKIDDSNKIDDIAKLENRTVSACWSIIYISFSISIIMYSSNSIPTNL